MPASLLTEHPLYPGLVVPSGARWGNHVRDAFPARAATFQGAYAIWMDRVCGTVVMNLDRLTTRVTCGVASSSPMRVSHQKPWSGTVTVPFPSEPIERLLDVGGAARTGACRLIPLHCG